MAVHWKINFHSLRAGTHYTVNIYDATYAGTSPIELKGGAQPFTTQEDENDDPFIPVRTQSGYLRIVDDWLDANGNAWDWKTILPATDTDRPVSLTKTVGSTTTIEWMGFMQAQNFGGVLYGNPQEREFPVQCCVSVLNSIKVTTTATALHNFAYIFYNFMVTQMPQHSFTHFVVQGGNDARRWLLAKVDWQNFLKETDENDFEPRYTLGGIIEDVCKFWGWTIRTKGQTVYLMCADDAAEQKLLTLTAAQLQSLANETITTAGDVSNMPTAIAMSGDIFASMNNDDYLDRGPNKATVKADINENEMVIKCFPPSVRKYLEEDGWQWVQGDSDLVGYFETRKQTSGFTSGILDGYALSGEGGFSRRQIFTSAESDEAQESDMLLYDHVYDGTAVVSLSTKKPVSFCGGSLILSGQIYFGSRLSDWDGLLKLPMRLGIGMTRANARWWYMRDKVATTVANLEYGWSQQGTVESFAAGLNGASITSTCFRFRHQQSGSAGIVTDTINFDAIPIQANEPNMYGYIFVDILGFLSDDSYCERFQIADFKIQFTRDIIQLPSTTNEKRARTKTADRVSTKEYTSENNNSVSVDNGWNADCIFASDNNMNYGYGLVMEPDGSFMATTGYNNGATAEHPEQHLANRVTSYWASAKRRLGVELRTNAITEPTPANKVTLDGSTLYPLAISRDWRDDITKLTLIQM